MLIAGEPSGDLLAAELVEAIRSEMAAGPPVPTTDYQPLRTSLEPRFFGAGGPRMSAAGVDITFDLSAHSVIGVSDVFRNLLKFWSFFRRLQRLALDREPDAIICVDFSGFNRRFAHAVKAHVRKHHDWFHDWNPRLIQYISPQVWASRPGRARHMARDYDLLLSIFPFEKDWYAQHTPGFRVEFVGHPMLDRYATVEKRTSPRDSATPPIVVLLPGSRPGELARHLPVLLPAVEKMLAAMPGLHSRMVLPNEPLAVQAKSFAAPASLKIQVGGLIEVLTNADLAIASTGTVTMECAYFGVPTVALYKTSWSNYQIGKRVVKVRFLAMPNLLANEEVFPEFVQDAATPDKIAEAGLALLRDQERRARTRAKLAEIIASLSGPGANRRAARAILKLMQWTT